MTADDFLPVNIPQDRLRNLVKEFGTSMKFDSGTTKHVYLKAVDRLIAYADSVPFSFTPGDFSQFRLWLLNQEKLRTNTVNTYLTGSRRFCEFLVESKVLSKNPAWSFHGTAQTYKVFGAKLSEIMRAVSGIDRSTIIGKRDHAFLTLILESGATISELINADIGDLKSNNKKVELWVRPKAARGRFEVITLTRQASQVLSEYVNARGPVLGDHPLFGTVRAGKVTTVRLSLRGVRAAMQKHLRLGAEKRLRLDSLRTYCAVKLMNQGRTLEEIREFMRFKSNVPFKKIITNSKAIAGIR